jgi:hypothetical protein
MAAKYILALLAAAFSVLGAAGIARSRRSAASGQARTWLLVGAIFAAVSAWLFYQG